MRTFLYTLFCFSLLMFSACSDEEGDTTPALSAGSRTVLVYMAADNNLIGFAYDDLEEMKQGMLQVSGAGEHFLVYMDFGNSARLVELTCRGGRVEETLVKSYDTPRNSVGLSETAEVFRDAFSIFPAESYGLVYWSHGDGWLPAKANSRWIGQDAFNGFMDITDLAAALESAPHLDFLLFDACFMQGIEVAYELRSFSEAFVGSPTETPAPGAPYHKIVPAMFMQQPAVEVARAYYDFYAAYFVDKKDVPDAELGYLPWNRQGDWIAGLSMAVVQSEELARLAQTTQHFLQNLSKPDVAQLRDMVFDYDKRRGAHCGYYDLYALMEQLLVPTDFAVWKQVYAETCAYWATTAYNFSDQGGLFPMDNAHGMSHYIPITFTGGNFNAYRQTAWYRDAGLSQLGW